MARSWLQVVYARRRLCAVASVMAFLLVLLWCLSGQSVVVTLGIDSALGLFSHRPVVVQTIYDLLEQGTWVPRIPPLTHSEVTGMWNGRYSATMRVFDRIANATNDTDIGARKARAVRLTNSVWEAQDERGNAEEWQWQDWVTMLLKSNGGMVIIGDSIHLQLIEHLHSLLPRDFHHEHVLKFNVIDNNAAVPGLNTITLSPHSPLSSALLMRAGAPLERLSRPIVSFYRSDLLYSLEQYLDARNSVTDDDWRETWAGHLRVGHGIRNVIFSDWLTYGKNITAPVQLEGGGEWMGPERTVLVVNSGTHWVPEALKLMTPSLMMRVYAHMVDELYPVLSSITNTRLLYRPTIPGHLHCEYFDGPIHNASELFELDFLKDRGWGMSDLFNDEWRRAMGTGASGHRGFLPVYVRSLLRPDIHRLFNDCLHMDGPMVLDEWTRWIWKALSELEAGWEAAASYSGIK